eukprot:TRINITY_DN67864_c0_g1_i1.p2 TRINITY_DN67864_c0_g1~~TRINITY_DN67864_c0_g1_i1.p2  ORF type:complete len:290 (+),score=76.48 TRINITY_DN67864_c0_g1_i1:29-871(+)
MKAFVAFAVVAAFLTASAAPLAARPRLVELRPVSLLGQPEVTIQEKIEVLRNKLSNKMKVGGGTECSLCVQFMDQFLNQLLNIILNGGVVGGCSSLCAKLSGSSVEQGVCNLLCDAVGVDAFIKAIQWADLDPVWLCEEIDLCKSTTCTANCTAIRSISVIPSAAPAGSTFNWTVAFSVLSKDVGVSTVGVTILSKNADSKGNHYSDSVIGFIPEPTVGSFGIILSEPTQTAGSNGNPGEKFPTGEYDSKAEYCEGMCGSSHKGSGEILSSKVGPTINLQ